MKTTNTQSAVNNAEFQQDIVDKNNSVYETQETYLNIVSEILNNKNVNFTEFTDEQWKATDISRLIWIRQWAMLDEQLSMLWLHKKSLQKKEDFQIVNNTISAPGWWKWYTVPLKWVA